MKLLFAFLVLFADLTPAKTLEKNNKRFANAPYVLLISLDGFRHDYVEKYQPRFLQEFAKRSSSLKSLVPSYPSKTFPNHYTIVTGLYPEHHGIVANHFYAPDLKREYKLSDREAVEDGRFYDGVPLWNLAVQNGMLSGTYFWPGSEAEINGLRPSYYLKYHHMTPHIVRINKVIEWFQMPKEKRPHLVTLYFHDVDSAGHMHGTDSSEVRDAIAKVDNSLRLLMEKLNKLQLPINVVIVSDHGMTDLSKKKVFNLASNKEIKKQLESYTVIGSGPIIHIYDSNRTSRKNKLKLINEINNLKMPFKAYLRSKLPKHLNADKNKRMGEIVVVANNGYTVTAKPGRMIKGTHGYDPTETMDMHGIFYAMGPNFKRNFQMPSTANIHIYPLIAEVLGLRINNVIDGDQRMFPMIERTLEKQEIISKK